eukprot:scaffold34504_cov36-Tisochrysis_lutea.AAC.2
MSAQEGVRPAAWTELGVEAVGCACIISLPQRFLPASSCVTTDNSTCSWDGAHWNPGRGTTAAQEGRITVQWRIVFLSEPVSRPSSSACASHAVIRRSPCAIRHGSPIADDGLCKALSAFSHATKETRQSKPQIDYYSYTLPHKALCTSETHGHGYQWHPSTTITISGISPHHD